MRAFVGNALLLLAAAACSPSRVAFRQADAPVIDVELEDNFGRIRAAVDQLAADRYEQVHIHVNTWADQRIETRVDLPATPFGNGLDVLVVVRVRTVGTTVGNEAVTTNTQLRNAAVRAALRAEKVVALVRVDDGTLVREVIGIVKTLKQSGFAAVVLAATRPNVPLVADDASDPAGPCTFPEGAAKMREAARVEVELDKLGQLTAVTVEDSRSAPHAFAAAMCAARRALTRDDYTFDPREGRRNRYLDDTPVMKTPRDVRP